jgi:hypothetical protein
MLTVIQLIEALVTLPPDTPVAMVMHDDPAMEMYAVGEVKLGEEFGFESDNHWMTDESAVVLISEDIVLVDPEEFEEVK